MKINKKNDPNHLMFHTRIFLNIIGIFSELILLVVEQKTFISSSNLLQLILYVEFK